MEFDVINKETRTCFKYGKKRHIRRFCKNKEKDLTNLETGKEASQIQEGDLEEKN